MTAKPAAIVALDIGTTSITVAVATVGAGAAMPVMGNSFGDAHNFSNGTGSVGPEALGKSVHRGTSSTSVIPPGAIQVAGLGSAPSRGLRKGVVINIDATVDAIRKAVHQAESMSGLPIQHVFAAISGGHIKSFNSHGVVAIRQREVSHYDIEKVIEAARAVAIPADREILHVLPQEFIIDGQDGIREPLGISGVRLEAKVHIITGAVASAQNIVKCANQCGLTVKDIVLGGLASGRVVVTPEEQELGVAVVDIGGGTSDVVVFQNGAVKFTGVVPVGGNHITSDIAAGLRTPVTAAEEIKCRYGVAAVKLVGTPEGGRDETIEVPSTGGRSPRVLSKNVLAEIIEPRVTEIFNLLERELGRAGCLESLSGGVVLTGGGANLRGIAACAEQTLGLPVRVGLPLGFGGITDLVRHPQHATVAGLLAHGAQALNQRNLGNGRTALGRTVRRVAHWMREHF